MCIPETPLTIFLDTPAVVAQGNYPGFELTFEIATNIIYYTKQFFFSFRALRFDFVVNIGDLKGIVISSCLS